MRKSNPSNPYRLTNRTLESPPETGPEIPKTDGEESSGSLI